MPRPIAAKPEEIALERILETIALELGARHQASSIAERNRSNPPFVLVGGTALRIAYGLARPSTDLDVVHLANEPDIATTLVPEILKRNGFEVLSAKPSSDIPIRTNLAIRPAGWRNLLKEHTTVVVDDIRTIDIHPDDVRYHKGIWTVAPVALVDLKLDAVRDGSSNVTKRIAGRDLYDLAFMLEQHPEVFTAHRLDQLSRILERSIHGPDRPRWDAAFTRDPVMSRSSLDEVVSELHIAVERGLDHEAAPIVAPARAAAAKLAASLPTTPRERLEQAQAHETERDSEYDRE